MGSDACFYCGCGALYGGMALIFGDFARCLVAGPVHGMTGHATIIAIGTATPSARTFLGMVRGKGW